MINLFYKKNNNVKLKDVLSLLNISEHFENLDVIINDIKDVSSAQETDITFFNSLKYKDAFLKSKASFCVTNKNFSKFIPKTCKPIIVDNILVSVSKITDLFYPNSINDEFDKNADLIKNSSDFKNLSFGKNVMLGSNVKIGENCSIGHNTIIESNVVIGNNCSIGSNVIIRKSIIGNNVSILDSSIIGKKGFGFFPNDKKNIRYPHIGLVIVEDNVEIGCNNVIDRGSLSNTIIGLNTFIDNQVHIAHNVKIGKNCIIAGQVGFAGSTVLGNNVMIGGQAGISGHLKIGDNVKIGGGSGVINDIPSNSVVMGYPAKNVKDFIKDNK
tara:strand:+ start:12887 stop:13867 length:981 start_codon:yes stop_codon:yes gene_type:complete